MTHGRRTATSSSPASAARSRCSSRATRADGAFTGQRRLLRAAPDRLLRPRARGEAERLVVLVGYAHDRHAAILDPTQPVVTYGQRAVVDDPACRGRATARTACGTYTEVNQPLARARPASRSTACGHDGTVPDPTLAGRQYDGVAAMAQQRATWSPRPSGPTAPAGSQRYNAAGVGALDAGFGGGRVPVAGVSFHAIKALADGSVLAAGDTPGGALASDRQMVVAKRLGHGAMAASAPAASLASWSAAGTTPARRWRSRATAKVIVGGAAIVGGRAGFGLARFTAAGVVDAHLRWRRSDDDGDPRRRRIRHRHGAQRPRARRLRTGQHHGRHRPGGRALLRDR